MEKEKVSQGESATAMGLNPSPYTYLRGTAPADLVKAAREGGANGVEKWIREQPLERLEAAKVDNCILPSWLHLANVLDEEIVKKRHREEITHLGEVTLRLGTVSRNALSAPRQDGVLLWNPLTKQDHILPPGNGA